jgi:hypothetical protein
MLAAAHGFLSGRRSGQPPSPSIPVPPSTDDGSNSVNPLLPERRERPISTSEQCRRAALESLRCELARRRANFTNTSPIASPPNQSESSNDSDGDESQPLTQPPATIMPRPPPSSPPSVLANDYIPPEDNYPPVPDKADNAIRLMLSAVWQISNPREYQVKAIFYLVCDVIDSRQHDRVLTFRCRGI